MSADFRTWSDFFWPGTEVLRNKLGLRDSEALEHDHSMEALGERSQYQIA